MKPRLKIKRLALIYLLLIAALLLSTCGPGENTNQGGEPTTTPGESTESDSEPEPPLVIPETPDGALIISVPAGEFLMGSKVEDDGEHGDEVEQHPVDMPEFLIYATEVTNRMYSQCVEEGECTLPAIQDEGPLSYFGDSAYDDYPVVGVTWYQAQSYCEWVGGRLPTEAEWEKAARGTEAFIYPWGNEPADFTRTNMVGATEPPTTKPVGSYPAGASPYELMDMAGNAYEWVYDWYNPNSYAPTAALLTAGVPFGDLRVARGGSFQDGPDTHRAAARYAFPPNEFGEFIGFRCTITGQEILTGFAPFCAQIYTSFCSPGGDLPTIDPRQPTQPDPNITVTGYPCPEGGTANISVDLGLPSAEGFTIYVNGLPYGNCYELAEYPGRLYCEGPAAPAGLTVEVTVCRNAASAAAPVSLIGGSLLASLDPSAYYIQPLQTAPGSADENCPDGYTFDPATGACIWDEPGDNCPDGWVFNPRTNECEPIDEGDCPPGTTLLTANFGAGSVETCVPDDGGEECPDGFTFDRMTQSCEPETNTGGFCPDGYYFNREINCCAPIPGDNFGCPPGTYYQPPVETLTHLTPGIAAAPGDRCVPISDEGCPYGFHYDRELGCVPDEGTDVPPGTPLTHMPTGNQDGCPPGTTAQTVNLGAGSVEVCVPDEEGGGQEGDDDCPPGASLNDLGLCVPDDGGPDCPDGTQYDARTQQCIEVEEGDCGPGFTLTHLTDGCGPGDGPGSTCPPGYSYHPRLNCCVPTPGMDGTRCPDDEQGDGGPVPLTFFAAAPTNFDYNAGVCNGDEPGECPEGYYYSEERGACIPYNSEDCPPGAEVVTVNFGSGSVEICVPADGGEECPDGWVYNPLNGQCEPEDQPGLPDCGERMYFDEQLGFCLPLNPGGCELGFTLDENGRCVPMQATISSGASGDGMVCPLGYYYDPERQTCVRGDSGQDCWTVRFTVPACPTPTAPQCPPGKHWNEKTQQCEDRPQEGGGGPAPCSSYSDQKTCLNAGCTWGPPPPGGPNVCQ